MAKKDFKKEDEQLENVGMALSTTGQWIEEHSSMLSWIVLAIAAVVLGIIAVNNYVIKPKRLEAGNEIAKAAAYFMQNDFAKALEGDDAECMGFEAIADKYKMYQQGKLAALYAGICHYKQGEYEEAAEYIGRFDAEDMMIDPAASQLLGDAYVQMDELDKAAKAFEAAAATGSELIAPMSLKKAGLVYLELGNNKAAKKVFETIKNQYPMSSEAQDIDKFIALAE